MTLEEAVASISKQADGVEEADPDALALLTRVALAFPKMLEALEATQEELVCPDAPSIGHRCGRCDEEVDRNQVVGGQIDAALRAAREAVKP